MSMTKVDADDANLEQTKKSFKDLHYMKKGNNLAMYN